MSSLYRVYCHGCALQNKVGFLSGGIETPYLSEEKADGMVALYRSSVISLSGCVIRNSAELPPIWRKKKDDPEVNSDYDRNLSLPSILFILTLFLFARVRRETGGGCTPVGMMCTCPPDFSGLREVKKCSSDVVLLRRLVELIKMNKEMGAAV